MLFIYNLLVRNRFLFSKVFPRNMYSDNERVDVNLLPCKCGSRLYLQNPPLSKRKKCDWCKNIKRTIVCNGCDFQKSICINNQCSANNKNIALRTGVEEEIEKATSSWWWYGAIVIILLVILVVSLSRSDLTNPIEKKNLNLIKTLRKDFPSQKNETWYDFLNMLDQEKPSVKSITFLHSKDLKTAVCLTKKLVHLYNHNKIIDLGEITFSPAGFETKDYGYALEHYLHIVKKFGVFVTHLNSVPGNIARIFHSLCDEVSSDVKPSLFIFTLQYNNTSEKLRPINRATAILKEVWSNLPESELLPLLSRVVKNAVDVIPEKQIKC